MTQDITKQTILVVDDVSVNIDLIRDALAPAYFVQAAVRGEMALKIIEKKKPDLVLLDIMMPEMDGYEVCGRLKANEQTQDIPVIFLTAKSEVVDETKGLELGAVDYITKPISMPILIARVKTHLALKHMSDFLKDKNTYLEGEVTKRTRQVQRIQDVTIIAMASLAETRDNETGNHILRTQRFMRALALELKKTPKFSAELSDEVIDLLYKSAPLHDIGKVGIPDHILLKPAQLTKEEFEIMKTHTTLGLNAIRRAEKNLEGEDGFLKYAGEIAHSHQEKWDGSGYPLGLAGENIPLSARLMAIADVYDALISKRVYKPAFSHEKAMEIILAGDGKDFDPNMIAVFRGMGKEFAAIAAEFSDHA